MGLIKAIFIIVLITISGISLTYAYELFKMLSKIQTKLGDKIFYWLIDEERIKDGK